MHTNHSCVPLFQYPTVINAGYLLAWENEARHDILCGTGTRRRVNLNPNQQAKKQVANLFLYSP